MVSCQKNWRTRARERQGLVLLARLGLSCFARDSLASLRASARSKAPSIGGPSKIFNQVHDDKNFASVGGLQAK